MSAALLMPPTVFQAGARVRFRDNRKRAPAVVMIYQMGSSGTRYGVKPDDGPIELDIPEASLAADDTPMPAPIMRVPHV